MKFWLLCALALFVDPHKFLIGDDVRRIALCFSTGKEFGVLKKKAKIMKTVLLVLFVLIDGRKNHLGFPSLEMFVFCYKGVGCTICFFELV